MRLTESARHINVPVNVLAQLAIVEDLVMMGVHHYVPHTRPRPHETIPGVDLQKTIVKDNSGVIVRYADVAPTIIVVLLEAILVNSSRDQRLIDQLNCGDDIGILSVSLGQSLNGLQGLRYCISLLPVDCAFAATVVESVLRARC